MEKVDSKLQRRQLELMKKRFDVDEENKIVKIDLYYDKAEDILDENIDTKVPSFNREKFGRIKDLIGDFPLDYKCDLNIKIGDYQDYKAEELMSGFNDAVELTHYSGNREHKKKWIQITLLLIAGILLLTIMAKGLVENWLSFNETGQSVFKEVFDITSWVFIWEAVSLLFLTPSETRLISIALARRLKNVKFVDANDKVLASEDYRDSYSNTVSEKKARTFAKYALLISGAAFLGLGISGLISSFGDVRLIITLTQQTETDPGAALVLLIIMLAISFVSIAFEIIGGIAAMSAFVGRGKFYKAMLPFGILSFIFEVLGLVFSIASGIFNVSYAVGVIIATAYLVGAILLIATKEKVNEKAKVK